MTTRNTKGTIRAVKVRAIRRAAEQSDPLCTLVRILKSHAGACLLLVVLLLNPAHAGVTNGDFQTGDLTGWDANTLIAPGSTPVSVGVATVGGSFVGQVNFASNVGGHYAGSLSQDFYSGGATELDFNFGFSASLQTAGQGIGVDNLDIEVIDLDTSTLLYHPLHAQNDANGLSVHTNGLGFLTTLPLSGSNTHLRVEVLMDLHTVDSLASSAQLSIDNVRLLPEPSSGLLAACGVMALAAARWFCRCA